MINRAVLRRLWRAAKSGWLKLEGPADSQWIATGRTNALNPEWWLLSTWGSVCTAEREPLVWTGPHKDSRGYADVAVQSPKGHKLSPAGVKAVRQIIWGMDAGLEGSPECSPEHARLIVEDAQVAEAVTVLQDLWKEHLVFDGPAR